ncbi:hypothetical protein MKZ38_006860 [Zalerion maritima]|uniref:Uncharacterized protein n=1 Tax=Zalerion maritima TaxID=339359 RepID=A0AAD5WPF9_9PEZI|nr:hypothetical protein MKZ38_006860 [Zalerion maritima]
MVVAKNLSFLLALLFAGCVAADAGDDFSNNLFSDLAPLLALFGERVTMQFMSQSMGWTDNIILAMAPLGIITVIISAIRVGGPVWLKTIIGRARENLAAAEMELMSSTSDEVCELWNGQGIVRCMGSAPVIEFICLLPKNLDRTSKSAELMPKVTMCDLKGAMEGGHLVKANLSIAEDFHRWWDDSKRPLSHRKPDLERSPGRQSPEAPEIYIVRNTAKAAPNISHNSHSYFWRVPLRIIAVIGIILQVVVLVYSGFATYHPKLKFQKDGRPVAGYAFPCTAIGTLVLVTGVLVCSHVVESSTDEDRYQPRGNGARMVWLQQTQKVSDQAFKSSAIFTPTHRSIITESYRAGTLGRATSRKHDPRSWLDRQLIVVILAVTSRYKSFRQHIGRARPSRRTPAASTEADGGMTEDQAYATILEVKTILGTLIGLCGFFVQFVGLRGMHWSASVAQLGAILVMTCLRAWVRRGLAMPPGSKSLISGFELEWFATTLGDLKKAPWLDTSDSGEEAAKDWRIVTGGNHEIYEKLSETKDHEASENGTSRAHTVMNIRRDLGMLANLHGPAFAEATALKRAIEVTMDVLFGSSGPGSFTWSLRVNYAGSDAQSIHFHFTRHNGKWEACSEIEAALSLWLFSVSDQDDIRSRTQGSHGEQNLRLLGPSTPSLRRDLRWWMPSDVSGVLEVEEDEGGLEEKDVLEVKHHRVVGCGRQQVGQNGSRGSSASSMSQQDIHSTRYGSTEPNFEVANVGIGKDTRNALLATASYDPLKILYAQDMFSAFMWAMAKRLKDPMEGGAETRHITSSASSWQSFTLRNDRLSKMAEDIQSTGLGSLDQIYLSVIPPLSVEQKLPQADEIIKLARQQAKRDEQLQHWKEAGAAYLWVFRATATFPADSGIAVRGTAVLMEYLRTVTLGIELKEAQQYENGDIRTLKEVKSELEAELDSKPKESESKVEQEMKTARRRVISNLMRLYKEQGREWKCDIVQKDGSAGEEDTSYPVTFNDTELHRLSRSRPGKGRAERKIGAALPHVNSKDIHDWTPLHYAAVTGSENAASKLLKHQANSNAQDLIEWTPLHYACQGGYLPIVQSLIQEGAELDASGRDRVAPLHCAAMNGHLPVVRLLVEAGAALDVLDALRNTPLHWAAYKGHQEVVRYLSQDANKRLRDHIGRTALHLAAMSGNGGDEVVKILLENGVDKKVRDRHGRTPLHGAAYGGHEAVAKLLLDALAEKEAKDNYGQTPLHRAAYGGHEAVAKLFLEAGAEKEATDNNGWTPLYGAAYGGHEAIAKLFLDAGAEKEAKDNDGWTPLYGAAFGGHEAVAKLLLNAGAEKEAKDNYGQTPLHKAADGGHEAVAKLFLEAGAEKKAKDNDGWTPLHGAAFGGHEAVAKLLLNAGAEKEAKDNDGWTPLYRAAYEGHEAVAKLLLDAGAEKEAKDNDGWTPLYRAAYGGHKAVTKLLLDAGAEKEAKDNNGWTPLYRAAYEGHEAVAKFFLDAGAEKEAKDNDGRTPLHGAAFGGHEAIAKLLLDAGAEKEAKDNDGRTPLHVTPAHKQGLVALLTP